MRNLRSRYCSLGKQFGAPDLTMLRYQIWIISKYGNTRDVLHYFTTVAIHRYLEPVK